MFDDIDRSKVNIFKKLPDAIIREIEEVGQVEFAARRVRRMRDDMKRMSIRTGCLRRGNMVIPFSTI